MINYDFDFRRHPMAMVEVDGSAAEIFSVESRLGRMTSVTGNRGVFLCGHKIRSKFITGYSIPKANKVAKKHEATISPRNLNN